MISRLSTRSSLPCDCELGPRSTRCHRVDVRLCLTRLIPRQIAFLVFALISNPSLSQQLSSFTYQDERLSAHLVQLSLSENRKQAVLAIEVQNRLTSPLAIAIGRNGKVEAVTDGGASLRGRLEGLPAISFRRRHSLAVEDYALIAANARFVLVGTLVKSNRREIAGQRASISLSLMRFEEGGGDAIPIGFSLVPFGYGLVSPSDEAELSTLSLMGPIDSLPDSTIAGSTPAILPELLNSSFQNCRGRLGLGCDGAPQPINPSYIQHPCAGDSELVCVQSGASAGSIRHDLCCDQAHADGQDGYMCGRLRETVGLIPGIRGVERCRREWEAAVDQWTPGYTFSHTWIYRTGEAATGEPLNWSLGIIPDGIMVDQENPDYDSVLCRSNSVGRNDVGRWVCGRRD